jgi:cell division protein FtsW
VLYAARLLTERQRRLKDPRQLLPIGLVAGSAVLLTASQPDLGTALVLAFTTGALLFAAGVPLRTLGLIAGVGAFLVLMYAISAPYRRDRLTAFMDPWHHSDTIGFQAVQGQIALGSGGLFGRGLGQSMQKNLFLPEAHTDFILAIIGEELGVMGIMGVVFLYGLIAYAGLRVAKNAAGRYAQLVAAGITALILCQATLNLFAILGLAPLTGVPLPFISYGSTNLVVLLAGMGLLLNVANGGSAKLRAVPTPRNTRRSAGGADPDSDRSRRDSRSRRPRDSGRRRAAG